MYLENSKNSVNSDSDNVINLESGDEGMRLKVAGSGDDG
jgi:hypothetical protein